MTRIPPLEPPYAAEVDEQLTRMMPNGVAPIGLFRTMARNLPMTVALSTWGGYELGPELTLSLRDREIVIDRTCARCGCEYEWGVHIAFFADAADLTREQVSSLTHGDADDSCWDHERDRLLIEAVDALHDTSDIGDALWARLLQTFEVSEVLDVLMLSGWYHAISYVATAARVALEPNAPRFADV